MINNVVLVGRLGRDVDLRATSNGTFVANASLGVPRSFTNSQGERETDWINLILWRKTAENFEKYAHKGSLVGIEGSIETRNYENQQGQRVYVTEVNVNKFTLLDSRNNQNNAGTATSSNQSVNYAGESQNAYTGQSSALSDDYVADISEEHLPF